jgi:Putative peptidoglycan binding domain
VKRSIVASSIVTAVTLSTGAGWFAATRVKSPAQIAAEAAPPDPSRITYPVERRVLSSDLIVRGTMRYGDPITVVLAPSLLRPPPVLVSSPPVKGSMLHEGDVAMVVSGRPVFAIAGSTPGYRDLGPGAVGADVRQLEEFLRRSGFSPGKVDGVFDAQTGAAVGRWYTKRGYGAFGPNELQRTALRLAETAVSQATDRLLLARQAELVNRSGAKPTDLIDGRSAVETAKVAVELARATAARDVAKAQADLALKQADVASKAADVVAKEAAVQSATIALEDARRRDALVNAGVNSATGVIVTAQQLSLLEDSLNDAKTSVAAAEADLESSEAVARTIRATGDAGIADARTKLSAAVVFAPDGLSGQQLLDANAAARIAQAAVTVAEAVASKDNSVAAADITVKRTALNVARAKVVQAQQRIDASKSGVDPVTGLPIVTAGDRASSQLAFKQGEIALRQSETALSAARAVLGAAEGDIVAAKLANEQTTSINRRAITDAQSRVAAAEARLHALSLPGVGTKTLKESVAVAQAEVTRLTTELAKTRETIGIQVPANEVVFFPTLPLRIDDTKIKRGDPAMTEVMTVSGTRLAVDSALLTTEAPLTKLGASSLIEAPEFGYSSQGTITFLADKPGLRGTDAQHIAIEVAPDDTSTQLVGASVRLTIPTRSTVGKALIVPVSALSIRADGSTQLQIEDSSGSIRTVIVTAGLSAQGFVEIVPVRGAVTPGERVVIGSNGAVATPEKSAPADSTVTAATLVGSTSSQSSPVSSSPSDTNAATTNVP